MAGSQFSIAYSKMVHVGPHRNDTGLTTEGGGFIHAYTFLIVFLNNKMNDFK